MSLILHTGFDKSIDSIKENFTDDRFIQIDSKIITESDLKNADLMLIGPLVPNPLQLAQSIAKQDSLISTILLPDQNEYATIKRSLLFTPFIGKSTACFYFDEEVYKQLQKAALQTKQRRSFARVEISLKQNAPHIAPKVEIEQLGNFLNQAPIGTILLNKDKDVVAVNSFGRRLFNLQPFETVTSLDAIWDTETVTAIKRNLQPDSTTKMMELNSKGQYYEVTFADVTSEKGEQLDILLVSNVTDRKLEDQRIRSVLDALPQMAWTTNANGEVTYLTEGWYKYTGQTFSEAMGEGWKTVIHDRDKDYFIKAWEESVAKGESFEQEARYKRADGKYRWHLVRGTPIFSGTNKLSYWLGTCTDIDEHKLLEEELSAKVKQSTAELLKMNMLLKKSNKDLEEFAYIASHDLKEPLRKMQAFINMAKSIEDEKKRHEFYDKVDDAARRMTRLIEDILEYSHLSKGSDYELVDMNKVLRNVLTDLEIAIKEKNATVTSDLLPVLEAVPVQMQQLMSNLISNSLKYSDKQPVITITCTESKPEQIKEFEGRQDITYLRFCFKDNGIGFEQKYADDIFTVFKRLHGRDHYSGSGVGLAMVKKIVQNHHGFIKAESELGKGAMFIFYLPTKQ
jgi:PAS domain S-box-containing protein